MKVKLAMAVAALALMPNLAAAACGITDAGSVNVISNFFPTLEVLSNAMKECATDKLKIDVKMTTSHKEETRDAFMAATSPYDAAAVANGSITLLQSEGLLRPLNDLVDKYRDSAKIEDQMLIRFGDDIMAVAFSVNAQVLFYREDLLAEAGITVPTTYNELLDALAKLKEQGKVAHPFGAAYGNSFELGNEYVNMLLANNGALFDPLTSEPTIQTPQAVEALELMGKLFTYMSPNSLAMDFGDVKRQLQQGEIAMAILWGDQAPTMDDPKESTEVGKIAFAPAPAMHAGGKPASLFWWDGYVMPKNSRNDPDLTFRVLMHALSPEVVAANNDTTLWIRSNYVPTEYTKAITDTVMSGVPPYPMNPHSFLIHTALGDNISAFLTGKEDAATALANASTAARAAMVEQRLLPN